MSAVTTADSAARADWIGCGQNARTSAMPRMRKVDIATPFRLILRKRDHAGRRPPSDSGRRSWYSLCVTREDKVARFDLIVAGKAGFHERLVARFAVLEVSGTPTARCGVLFCFLDHKLNVRWGAGYERLGLAKDFVVFLRRHVTEMQSGNDRAVWERDLPFAVGLDR